MTGEPGELTVTELRIEAPGARAFRLSGHLTAAQTPELIGRLRDVLNPRPKRLFFDISKLTRIDRAGMDTLIGLAGVFDDAEGYLAVVAAPKALQDKLREQAPFQFFDTFAQGAVRVMDDMLVRLSGQYRALPARPATTETVKAIWSGIRDSKPGVQVLKLSGNFDKVSAPQFARHWQDDFKESTRHLVIDLAEVRTVVDEGLEWLRRMAEALRARDGTVVLCNPKPKIQVMLDMLDMTSLFRFAHSVEEAEAMLSPS